MKLIHISDIHLTENGTEIWGVNTLNQFCKAIKTIKELDGIDAIVISGDLSNDGSRWTYEFIDQIFKEIGIPTYCCPGNHDNLEMFYHGYKPSFVKICDEFELRGWNFIMINSAVEGMSRGSFNPQLLSKQISNCSGPIAIVLHHPPLEQEGWLNRKLLENRDEFNDIICHAGNIKLVLYGHTHYHTIKTFSGVVYSSAPSTGFAFNPILPKFEIAKGEEGLNIIEIDNKNITINNIRL